VTVGASTGRPRGWADPAHPQHHPGAGPPRGYKWEQFKPGHKLAQRHGATPRVFPPGEAQEVALEVLGEELVGRYGAAACLFGELWERRRRALVYLDEHGMVTPDGKPSPLLGYLGTWESNLLKLLAQFGQTPVGEAQLRKLVTELEATTVDLEALREKGRAARLAAVEALEATVEPATLPESAATGSEPPGPAEEDET
jgi:hypothetical protein